MWFQKEIILKAKSRGCHLITSELLANMPELKNFQCGLLHIFIKHTSASLTINENADPTVRQDLEAYLNKSIPENEPYYQHTYEGADDMPAHIKSSVLGSSISLPISNGRLNLGCWQGIYLCEHRNKGGCRSLIVTISGE